MLTYTISSGITAGSTYKFKVRAYNKWGAGAFSSELSVLAASVPSAITTVTTSIDSSTGGVQITWTLPSINGSPLTAYIIKVKNGAGTFVTDASCDGSLSTIITARSCIIPMTTLTSSLSLTYDTLIEVTV